MKNARIDFENKKLCVCDTHCSTHQFLIKEYREYVLSKQILRSGTAIGALIREAEYGQSKADFRSKMSIALKEASETEYWLNLLKDTDYINEKMFVSLSNDCVELIKLLYRNSKNNPARKIGSRSLFIVHYSLFTIHYSLFVTI